MFSYLAYISNIVGNQKEILRSNNIIPSVFAVSIFNGFYQVLEFSFMNNKAFEKHWIVKIYGFTKPPCSIKINIFT